MEGKKPMGHGARPRYTAMLLFALTVVGGLLLAACAKNEKADEQEARVAESDLPLMEEGVILPHEPLWPEGMRMSPEVRDEVILRRSHGLDKLYRQAMETHGDTLSGKMTLRFLVYPDGTVGPPEILETSWNVREAQYLTDEMAALVARWTFPPGEKTVAITQPWRFEP